MKSGYVAIVRIKQLEKKSQFRYSQFHKSLPLFTYCVYCTALDIDRDMMWAVLDFTIAIRENLTIV